MSTTVIDTTIATAEAQVLQLLLAHDVDALQAWLSPSLFFSDGAGQWLGAHPCLTGWSTGQLRITALEQAAVESLVCGQLTLVSSDVRLRYADAAGEHARALRLLRVWASASNAAGVHLLSIALLPPRAV
ncbi:nuclear transport factor 2 family protein [Stenotrophomonas sp. P5_B8]